MRYETPRSACAKSTSQPAGPKVTKQRTAELTRPTALLAIAVRFCNVLASLINYKMFTTYQFKTRCKGGGGRQS